MSCCTSSLPICGKYSNEELNQLSRSGKPQWIQSPGENCAVGYADWGNSNKEAAQATAFEMAKEGLVREIAPEKVSVDSEIEIQKKKVDRKVTVFAKGSSRMTSMGEEVEIQTKRRAVWFDGFKVWVLVERLQ